MIQLEIKENITISNRDIVKGILSMDIEHQVDILERLISMETTEKQKWNIIALAQNICAACRGLRRNQLCR